MIFTSQIFSANKKDPPIILEEKLFWIGCGISILGLLMRELSDEIAGIEWIKLIGEITVIAGLILFLYGRFASMVKNEPLNGNLMESIKISLEKINIGQTEYEISEIKKFSFFADDYNGKMYPKYNYIGPWCSNGVKSNILFEYNGKKICESFYVADKSEMKELKKLLEELKNTVANNAQKKLRNIND